LLIFYSEVAINIFPVHYSEEAFNLPIILLSAFAIKSYFLSRSFAFKGLFYLFWGLTTKRRRKEEEEREEERSWYIFV